MKFKSEWIMMTEIEIEWIGMKDSSWSVNRGKRQAR